MTPSTRKNLFGIGIVFAAGAVACGSSSYASPDAGSSSSSSRAPGASTDSSRDAGAQSDGAIGKSDDTDDASPGDSAVPPGMGWVEIANTKLEDACPASTDCKNVVAAWSGGIADTRRNRLVVWGGGHDDYSGNEVYALDLDALTMSRLNSPSPPSGDCVETLSDGTPPSRHTYNGLSYVPDTDSMFSYTGSMNPTGCASNAIWMFAIGTLKWNLANLDTPHLENGGHAASDYDPNTKKFSSTPRATDSSRRSIRRPQRSRSSMAIRCPTAIR